MENYDLHRFTQMHKLDFEAALSEIKRGRKESHWMWYIFPQIQGLGMSDTSKYYAIRDINEARAFLNDEYLGGNLVQICRALLEQGSCNATEILGKPDDMKLKSSMTLFSIASEGNPVFDMVLDKFFGGKKDYLTLRILGL